MSQQYEGFEKALWLSSAQRAKLYSSVRLFNLA